MEVFRSVQNLQGIGNGTSPTLNPIFIILKCTEWVAISLDATAIMTTLKNEYDAPHHEAENLQAKQIYSRRIVSTMNIVQ